VSPVERMVRSSMSPEPEETKELEEFLDCSNTVRSQLAAVRDRDVKEEHKLRRENMMLLMIAMERKLSTTSVKYCRHLLDSNNKSV